MLKPLPAVLLALLLALGPPRPATAQLADQRWSADFPPTGCNGVIYALAAGASGEIYVGGSFTRCGGVAASNVARYDPETAAWSALGGGGGEGVDQRVAALAVAGDDLYVGGFFTEANVGAPIAANRVARWDGASWSALGSGGGNGVDNNVLALAASGPDLYVGGNFLAANVGSPITVNRIARWDGSAWSPLGSAGGVGVSSNVFALAVAGSDLYVGGAFTQANVGSPLTVNFVARWDGGTWSALDSGTGKGVGNSVSALAVKGGDLFVGGNFTIVNAGPAAVAASRIARWDGMTWSAVGSAGGNGFDAGVSALAVAGGDLYAGGSFTQANLGAPVAAHRVARWNGSAWTALDGGVGEGTDGAVSALVASAGVVYAAGAFQRANLGGDELLADRIAAWSGGGWSTVGPLGGVGPFVAGTLPSRVHALAVLGDDVYLGGSFSRAGGVAANNLARYHRPTRTWSAVGTGAGNGTDGAVRALLVEGTDLYVGGDFTAVNSGDPLVANRLARWDGASWSALGDGGGEGLDNRVAALAWCGGALFAGGDFTQANVGAPVAANRIARWDGASWSPLGSGGGNGLSSSVFALACSGADLFVGGSFDQANHGAPIQVNRIARWDGASWSALGGGGGAGVDGAVNALAVLGGDLYAGGSFTEVNVGAAIAADHVARWDGWTWSVLGSAAGSGVDGAVHALAVSAWDLYVGGEFTVADGGAPLPASRVAHWSGGGGWAPLGSGTDLPVRALALLSADELVAGGDFGLAGDQPSSRVGLYRARGTLHAFIDGGLGRVTSSPNGIACPGTCDADFAWDVPITLTAIPDPGYRFDGWTGGGCGGGPCVLSLEEDTGVVASFSLAPEADLAIQLGDLEDPPAPGAHVVYTTRVDNLAPLFQASGVVVTSALPAGLTLVATEGCLEDPAGLPTCTLGSLAAGTSASFLVEASVDPDAPAMVVHQACVAGADPDPNPANDCDGESTELPPPDLVAPTVTGIASTAGSGDGAVLECATVRAQVVALRAAFSEAVAAGGAVDPASAVNPDNYRLVAPAAGAGFDTTGCQGGSGGDTVIAIDGVSWDAGALAATLTVNGAAPLPDGLYRLVVCGTIADEAGNALDGGAGVGSDFVRTFRVDAHNLLAGGHFDRFDPLACTLAAWESSDLGQVEIAAEDVETSPLSGAAHNVVPSAGLDLAQCVPLGDDELYVLRAAVRADESGGQAPVAELSCELFGLADCGGEVLGTVLASVGLAETALDWVDLRLDLDPPAGTVSGRCGAAANPGDALAVEVYFDDLSLAVRPLFADGFESGGTGGWTLAVP